MRGRVGGGGANGGAPTDLLVCFPSKAHLGLIPKPICSPARPGEPGKRNGGKGGGRGQASPLFKNKSKDLSNEIAEPTSPKVTCAGQIKVTPKPRPRPDNNSKDWLSVVEEIERFHKEKKRPHWLEGLGIKKDIMQFLGALRGLRFDMRCFGSFHGAVDCSSGDEDEDDDDDEEDDVDDVDGDDQDEDKSNSSNSRTIFSKWFMVLEESQSNACKKEEEEEKDVAPSSSSSSSVPPPNALLLMRCRSAPAKGWVEGDEGEKRLEEEMNVIRTLREEEKEKERLILMSYAPDFFKVSTDIAKETWVVGGMDPLARSRSWRR